MPLDKNVLKGILPEVRKKPRPWNADYVNRDLVASICIERLDDEPVISVVAGCRDCDDLV